ncbi:hypothetical protein [Paenibacillus polymyxa]|uniref:Uncharacterized protein n=1 Tax=Paenibacillus polymyxa (strain SC2) TaxID=886882 RepID=E3EKB3_PAEPS|nr:hypothetical protein [Paenibacillus polymyxa]ADO59440.1 hypothetical protein PPSC2_27860 [Paenibacillus polymyxa SC2]WPQ59720.1 hypothetical protein SKN87_29100 [Paenibacillus polymyxa]
MKVHDLVLSISFADVLKELIITNANYKNRLNEFLIYFQKLNKEINVKDETRNSYSGILTIDRYSYARCYVSTERNKVYIPVKEYLHANVGDWEIENVSPSLLVAALLVTLTEEGDCFTERERLEFARKLYWHSYALNIKTTMLKNKLF